MSSASCRWLVAGVTLLACAAAMGAFGTSPAAAFDLYVHDAYTGAPVVGAWVAVIWNYPDFGFSYFDWNGVTDADGHCEVPPFFETDDLYLYILASGYGEWCSSLMGMGSPSPVHVELEPSPPDLLPPTTAVVGAEVLWHHSPVVLTFVPSDPTPSSGIAYTESAIDGGAFVRGETRVVPAPGDHSNDGIHIVGYRSADRRYHVERAKTVNVGVDTAAPTTSASGGESVWYRASVIVEFAAADPPAGQAAQSSGLARTDYRIDGGSWTEGARVIVPAPSDHSNDGIHTLEYRSTDKADNVEAVKSCEVRIDTRAPQVTCTDDGTWHNAGVTVELQATDALYGVKTVEHRLWPAVVWQQGSQVEFPTRSGVWRLSYRATDSAGNTSQPAVAVVKIDTLGPTTTSFIPLDVRKGRQAVAPIAVYDDLSVSLACTLEVTARSSGAVVKTVDLGRLRANRWHTATFTCDLPRGRYRYRILAVDLAGNPQTRAYGGTLRVR